MPETLLDDWEVSRRVRRARSTLQKDRLTGRGIRFVRVGALVRCRDADVESYIASLPAGSDAPPVS